MTARLTIAALLGLAFGLIARTDLRAPGLVDSSKSPPPTPSSQRLTNPLPSFSEPTLAWNLRGDLTSSEILALPPGARRTAEFTLWSLTASSEDLASHWDQLLSEKKSDDWALDHALTAWIRRFPLDALAHTKGTEQEYRFWWAFGRADPEHALSLIDRSPSNSRNLAFLIRGMGSTDAQLALSLLDQFPQIDRHHVLGGIVDGISETDPQKAIELISRHQLYHSNYLQTWAHRDPHAAFSWILENRTLAQSTIAQSLPALVSIMMAEDPAFAASQIKALPTGSLKNQLLAAQASELAKTHPEEALDLAKQHEGSTQTAMITGLLDTLSYTHPKEALAILKEITPAAAHQQNPDLDQHWSKSWLTPLLLEDPEAVMAIATSTGLPNPTSSAFNYWVHLDSGAALDWLSHQPDQQTQRNLFGRVTQNLGNGSQHDFTQLLDLSHQVGADLLEVQSIISTWKKTAPVEAETYFNSGRATPEQQEIARELFQAQ